MICHFTKDRALSSKCSSSTANCKNANSFHLRILGFFFFLFPWGSGRANPLQLPLPRSSRATPSLGAETRRGFCLGCRLKALLNQHSARQSKFQELEGVCVFARRNILQPRLARLPKHTVSAARTSLGAKKHTHSAGYSSRAGKFSF